MLRYVCSKKGNQINILQSRCEKDPWRDFTLIFNILVFHTKKFIWKHVTIKPCVEKKVLCDGVMSMCIGNTFVDLTCQGKARDFDVAIGYLLLQHNHSFWFLFKKLQINICMHNRSDYNNGTGTIIFFMEKLSWLQVLSKRGVLNVADRWR